MPSKARRKPKTKRKPVDLAPWLWVAVVLNVAAGLAFSPLTAVTRLRVVGAMPEDEEALTRQAQELRGIPFLRLNPGLAEERAAALGDVKHADFHGNLFGRAVLRLESREIAAAVEGQPGLALDQEGQIFATLRPLDGQTSVRLPEGALSPSLSLTSGTDTARLARLCTELAAQLPNLGAKLAVDGRGVLSLQTDKGLEVVLGSTDGLTQKFARLRSLLERDPGLERKGRQLILVAPDNPVVRG